MSILKNITDKRETKKCEVCNQEMQKSTFWIKRTALNCQNKECPLKK